MVFAAGIQQGEVKMIKLGCSSLDEVPEGLRGICSVENGVVSLDDSKLKTEQDVQKALDARDHEKNDHKATKEKLAVWQKLGKTPEEIQTIIDEYPTLKEGAKSNEDYLNERKAHLATQRDRDAFKSKFEDAERQVKELQSFKDAGLRAAKWKEIRTRLGEKYDADKLDMLYEDIEDKLQIDEIGEFMPYKGKSVEEYFANRAERMGWTIHNTPGKSQPGTEKIPPKLPSSKNVPLPGSGDGFLDDDIAAQLDS